MYLYAFLRKCNCEIDEKGKKYSSKLTRKETTSKWLCAEVTFEISCGNQIMTKFLLKSSVMLVPSK